VPPITIFCNVPRPRSHLGRVSALALLGLSAASGVAGCTAPLADFRPPSALVRGDRTLEVGGGAVMVTPRPYVIESSHREGQLWVTGRVAPWLSLSALGGFDSHTAMGGGAALARFLTTDRFVAGVGGELGYAWAGASLSGAVRLFDDTWLYTAPRMANWGILIGGGVPVGVSARIYRGLVLRAEAQASWEAFKYYNRRFHFGAAAAYEW
jgi:hypothetical protein